MKKTLLTLALAILVLAACLGLTSMARTPQQTQKQFVLLMKATGPEFFKKTQEPEGMQMVEKHFKKLKALTDAGVVVLSGHTTNTDESGFGIIVVRAESAADAQKVIDDDDLVKAGLVRGTVFPFQIVTAGK